MQMEKWGWYLVVGSISHRLCKQNESVLCLCCCFFWHESSAFSAFTGCIFRNDTGWKLHATGNLARACSHCHCHGGGEGRRLKVSLPRRRRVTLPLCRWLCSSRVSFEKVFFIVPSCQEVLRLSAECVQKRSRAEKKCTKCHPWIFFFSLCVFPFPENP